MLKANKSRVFEEIFALYNRNLLRRRFQGFHIDGLRFLQVKDEESPLIVYANHSSWWDGLVAFEISRLAGLDAFIMMEEKQLRKLFLFRLLGAFSVVRDVPREAARSIAYAVELLQEKPQRTLWIFPQGEILPNDARPLGFYRGLAKIVEKTGRCQVACLALRYEFLGGYKPEVFVKIGRPKPQDSGRVNSAKSLTDDFAEELTAILDQLKDEVISGKIADYERVF